MLGHARPSGRLRRGSTSARGDAPDAGVTFVELLVAIVLLGTAIVAVLAAFRATVLSSAVGRDHAQARVWLESAAEQLQGLPLQDCGLGEEEIREEYESSLLALAAPPDGWNASQLSVVPHIMFWDGGAFQTTCAAGSAFNLQLVKIRIEGQDGQTLETVEVVKDEPRVSVAPVT